MGRWKRAIFAVLVLLLFACTTAALLTRGRSRPTPTVSLQIAKQTLEQVIPVTVSAALPPTISAGGCDFHIDFSGRL